MEPSPPADSAADQDIDALFLRCRDRLLTRIRWMMGQSARRVAESGDFLGGLYLRVRQEASRREVRDEKHLLNLAIRIARQLIVDQARRPRVQRFDSLGSALSDSRVEASRADAPSAAADDQENSVRVLEALEALPEDYQLVIELRDFEGHSFQAIGERMRRTENATQILHRRALTRLGSLLRPRPAQQ